MAHRKTEFGGRLICDFSHTDISSYQSRRLAAGKAPRIVNFEVGTLRGILKQFGLGSRQQGSRASKGRWRAEDRADHRWEKEEEVLLEGAPKISLARPAPHVRFTACR